MRGALNTDVSYKKKDPLQPDIDGSGVEVFLGAMPHATAMGLRKGDVT